MRALLSSLRRCASRAARRFGALLAASALSACVPGPYLSLPVQIVQAAPDPLPPGTYARERVPTPAVQTCASRIPSEAASCLLATNEEAAFPALLVLGLQGRRLDSDTDGDEVPHAFEDNAGAAITAGKLALRLGTGELEAMLADPNPATQGFALRALRAMLESSAKDGRFAALDPRLAGLCAPRVATAAAPVAMGAALCVAASRDEAALLTLVEPFVQRSELAVRDQVGKALLGARDQSFPDDKLQRLAAFLRTPLSPTWPADRLRSYDQGCAILAAQAPGASWAVEAGRAASEAQRKAGMTPMECGRLGQIGRAKAPAPEAF